MKRKPLSDLALLFWNDLLDADRLNKNQRAAMKAAIEEDRENLDKWYDEDGDEYHHHLSVINDALRDLG